MAVQRVTISLPTDVYRDLEKFAPSGGVSEFVAKTLRTTFMLMKLKRKESAVEQIIRLRESGPKYTADEIQEFIDKGRP